ncbi:type IV pilus assembly protein PilF [Gammaproteobacteria bacterium]
MTGTHSLCWSWGRTLVGAGLLIFATGCAGPSNSVADAYESKPRNPAEAYANLGRQYLLRDSLDLALTRLQRAIRLNPDLPAAHHDLAVVYSKMGNLDAAGDEYRIALKLIPRDPTTLYNYATLLYNQGNYSEAETQLQTLISNPTADNRTQAYEALGLIAIKLGDSAKAEGYLEQSLRTDANQPRALLELAQIALDGGRLPQAKNYFRRYQEIVHDTPEGLWFGVLLERAQGDDRMVADYSQRLRVKFPDSPQARQLYAERINRQ